jgi:hypothetical protein
MILLEQHITINIYHRQQLQHFDVFEILTDAGVLSFKVMKDSKYYFTLIGENENNVFRLHLSDEDINMDIDTELLSKVKVSLYSVFLNEKAS